MNLPFFIARRYLFSTRKKNFINIISIISVIVVSLVTASLIVVLSVFNGLGELLRSLNNSFDPPIKIEATKGKSFEATPELLEKIQNTQGVDIITQVVEDYAYVRYRDANQVVTIKGVSDNFLDQHRIDKAIVQGELALKKGNTSYALIGRGIQYALSIDVEEGVHALHVYYVKNIKGGSIDPSRLYTQKSIMPGAVFSIIQNLDDGYIVVPLDFAVELMNYGDRRTSLEIKTKNEADVTLVQEKLQNILGDSFKVLSMEQQHQDLYRLLKMEKLFSFLAFTLLLCIGSINIFFSLMMLALDKKKDVSILSAMGAPVDTIRKVFLLEGVLIALLGTFLGLFIGGSLCIIQQHYDLVSMGMQSSVTDGYPVKMVPMDFFYVLTVMSLITLLISYRPASLAARFSSVQNL
ncbi:MAG TPA: FtsX-like permease family protein [Cyclobacteriaceae bacterium]|nr:FtsX-like permease family protein [Cyclobacteriaceae bacterium]